MNPRRDAYLTPDRAASKVKIAIFDLDGTLAESKAAITHEMASAIKRLLGRFDVAVISGGAWPQFESQLIGHLELDPDESARLHLFPTSGTSFYTLVDGKWTRMYSDVLTDVEVQKVMSAFKTVLKDPGVKMPKRLWGDQIENRGTQITFSAMGQKAPVEEKKRWDPTFQKRLAIIEKLMLLIPEFELRAGGSTSIDVTHKGIDKAHGIRQIEKYLGFSRDDMVFVGDALMPGGNDASVIGTGVKCISTDGPQMSLRIIEDFLNG